MAGPTWWCPWETKSSSSISRRRRRRTRRRLRWQPHSPRFGNEGTRKNIVGGPSIGSPLPAGVRPATCLRFGLRGTEIRHREEPHTLWHSQRCSTHQGGSKGPKLHRWTGSGCDPVHDRDQDVCESWRAARERFAALSCRPDPTLGLATPSDRVIERTADSLGSGLRQYERPRERLRKCHNAVSPRTRSGPSERGLVTALLRPGLEALTAAGAAGAECPQHASTGRLS